MSNATSRALLTGLRNRSINVVTASTFLVDISAGGEVTLAVREERGEVCVPVERELSLPTPVRGL